MNVSSQASIVSEIVPRVIGILVNGDGIPIPVPIHHIGPVNGCNLKVIAVEPESFTGTALNVEYMTRSQPEPEPTVREWVVDSGNMFMLDPLFPFDVRPDSSDRASIWRTSLLWSNTLRLATTDSPRELDKWPRCNLGGEEQSKSKFRPAKR